MWVSDLVCCSGKSFASLKLVDFAKFREPVSCCVYMALSAQEIIEGKLKSSVWVNVR